MKKIIFLLIILFIPIYVYAISAESYIVIDADTNRILDGKNYNKQKLIASTTKIMTSIIVLENSDINTEVEVGNEILKAYGSNIYIEVGEKITIKDLLYGLMLRSGNDAAIELAYAVSGSMEEFVKLMNELARKLGMNNTTFINNSGLEDVDGNGNTSTAYDMAILMSYALKNEDFKTIINTKNYNVTTNYKSYSWKNKNKLLFNYEYCIGGKTGYTKKAKRTLVTSAVKDDKNLIVVTLNDPSDFTDHETLYESNFKKYNKVKVLSKNKLNIENNIYYDELYINNDIDLLLTKEEEKKIKINYEISNINNYKNNDIVGKVIIKLDNDTIYTEDIYAKKQEEIKESIWSKILNFFKFNK